MEKQGISLDYLAGFMDGEGSIFASGKKGDLVISITNTDEDIILLIQKQYGGYIQEIKGKDNCRTTWRVSWFGKGVKALLVLLQDRLILKKMQAKLVLEYPMHQGYAFTKEEAVLRQYIAGSLRILNSKGKKRVNSID